MSFYIFLHLHLQNRYAPILQGDILGLIISKCLEIDVEIVIEDGGGAQLVEEYAGEDEDDEGMFQLDMDIGGEHPNLGHPNPITGGMGVGVNRKPRSGSTLGLEAAQRIPGEVSEMADKLDALLLLMVQVCTNTSTSTNTNTKLIISDL